MTEIHNTDVDLVDRVLGVTVFLVGVCFVIAAVVLAAAGGAERHQPVPPAGTTTTSTSWQSGPGDLVEITP